MAFYLNLSLARKFMLSLLLVGILPMLAISQLSLGVASDNLDRQIHNQLDAVRDIKAASIKRHFDQAEAQVVSLATAPSTQAALEQFSSGFATVAEEDGLDTDRQKALLAGLYTYYATDFTDRFKEQNSGAKPDTSSLLKKISLESQLLQALYISNNNNVLGSKHLLNAVDGSASYHRAHAEFHPILRDYLQQFGLYDIFLVDSATGNVVYTVFKELDFGTNLLDGPYANTNLAQAFTQARELKRGEVTIEDFNMYLPSYNSAASFIATPVYRGEEQLGVVIFQLPLEPVNEIMSERTGMGSTGESYLVGPDKLMRSDSRRDPLNHTVVASFRHPDLGSVDTLATKEALSGTTGSNLISDYNGNQVLSSYAPLDLGHFTWALMVEIDQAEAFASITTLKKLTLVSMVVAAILIALLAWFNSSLLTKPILALSACIQQVKRDGSFKHRVDVTQRDEIGMTARMFNSLLEDVGNVIASTNRVLKALSQGRFNESLTGNYSGDLGNLVAGVNDAVGQIRNANLDIHKQTELARENARLAEQAAETIKSRAQEALIIKRALDTADNSTMIFDPDFRITYANQAMVKLFEQCADVFRSLKLDSRQLPGTDIAVFASCSPQLHKLIYSKVRNASDNCVIGNISFTINATAILDDEGKFIGKILEWHDRTAEIAIEHEIDNMIASAATGNFTRLIDTRDKKGFALNISAGLNNLLSTTRTALQDVMGVFSSLAKGDLTCAINRDYEGDFAILKRDANATIERLNNVVNNIADASSLIASSSSQISVGISDLNLRTEEQAASLEETASCIEQIMKTVDNNLHNAKKGSEMAAGSFEFAKNGSESVQKSVSAMQDIERSSARIANIVTVIDGIAFQTNLLALNAAVEAARAGDQGRGFAVVANEVRQLAQSSAGAAREIKDLIGTSVNQIRSGTSLVSTSGETLSLMVGEIREVSSMMGDLMLSAQEQASGIGQVTTAISRIDTMTQQNAALVEQATAASEVMAAKAREMNELVQFFKRADQNVRPGRARVARVNG